MKTLLRAFYFSLGAFFFVVGVAQASPAITSFSPSSGPVGTLVTVTGTGLNSATTVTIGNVSAVIISKADAQLVAMVMPKATNGPVVINGITSTGSFIVTTSIPPVTQQGNKLVGSDYVKGTNGVTQGYSVALSADGNTALVGGYSDHNQGAAWVYVRNNGAWTQQGPKLVGTPLIGSNNALQGYSVALSADGNTALVGAPGDGNESGCAYVFTRNGTTWSQEMKLTGTSNMGAQLGTSVALSADGNTALAGGYHDLNTTNFHNIGATWVFKRSISTHSWVQQAKLVGSLSDGDSGQGQSVALSADGKTAVIGGRNDNNAKGAVWVFVFSDITNTWTQQGSKLVGATTSATAWQGISVSVSADGNTLIEGGSADNNSTGAAWVFVRDPVAGTWTAQGAKIVGTGATGKASQGFSVSLSADGNTAMVGCNSSNNPGTSWLYTRSGSSWNPGTKLTASNATSSTIFPAISVALSGDGNTGLVGGSGDSNGIGAAWPFLSPPVITLTGTLNAFSSNQGSTSTSQYFSVSGSNLSAAITVTAPAGFEVSTDNTTFSSSVYLTPVAGLVSSSKIYVRIAATATTGILSDNVTVSSTNVAAQTVAVSGTVIAPPTPTIAPTASFSAFTTTSGTPSSPQTFTISGSNLTDDITVTAPNGFEVSKDNSTFSSSVTLAQLSGSVSAVPVYIRLTASATGTPSGSVTITSTGASTASLTVSGTVSGAPPTVITNAATMVGPTSAYLNGKVTSAGSSTLTARGFVWDTSANPTINSTGKWSDLPANVAIGSYTQNLGNFLSNTTYHVRAYATNAAGTAYGDDVTFTTAPKPTVSATAALTAFNTTAGAVSATQTFTVSGANLISGLVVTAPDGFEIASGTDPFSSYVILTPVSGSVNETTIYVRMAATATGNVSDNILVQSQLAVDKDIAVTGTVSSVNAAPVNSILPTITGIIKVDNQLTAAPGTWTDADNDVLTYSYQWYRANDNAGTNSVAIAGQTTSTYTLTTADAHQYVSVKVTANDGKGGTASAASAWSLTSNQAPVNSVLPTISGTLKVTNQLTAATGTWTDADNDVLTYSYQWYRADDNAGTNSVAIAGQTTSTYTLTTADAHQYVSVKVTANDGKGGSASAASAWSLTSNQAPVNSVLPTISGTLKVTNQLTAATGTWTDADNDVLTYSYQWYRADDNAGTNSVAIAGQTTSTYTLTTADAHQYVSVKVTANDGKGGTATAASAWSLVVNSAPVNTLEPTITGTMVSGNTVTAINGTWADADNDALTYSYKWFRGDDAAGSNSENVVTNTTGNYDLGVDDINKYINVLVIATDGKGETAYGSSDWEKIGPPDPSITIANNFSEFSTMAGTPSSAQSFTINAEFLTDDVIITAPQGFEVSKYGSSYGSSVTLTPSMGQLGNAMVYVRLTSSATGTPSGNITIASVGTTTQNIAISGVVNTLPNIIVSPASLPDGVVATTYHQALTASGGMGTYTYAVTGGMLPDGITLSAAGMLSGTPTVDGTFNFVVTATDSSTGTGPYTGSQAFSLIIARPTIVTSGSLTALNTSYGSVSSAINFTVSGSNLAGDVLVTAPNGFEVSTSPNHDFGGTTVLTQSGGSVSSTIVYVRLTANNAPGTYSGNVVLSSPNATGVNLAIAASDVNKKQLTVTLNGTPPISKGYDGNTSATLFSDNYTLNGIVGADEVSVSGTASYADANAGDGKIVTANNFLLAGAQKDNYTIATTSATTTGGITAKAITVTADAQSKIYGESDPALTSSVNPALVPGDSFSGSLTRDVSEDAGNYVIKQGTLTAGSNYEITYIGANLTISKATATLALDDASLTQTYDGSAKQVAAFTNPINLGGVSITYNNLATPPTHVGTYQVKVELNNNNYSAPPVTGTLNVTLATPTITFNALSNKTYGDADFAPGASSTNTAVPVTYASSNTLVATIVAGRVRIVGAGQTTIKATQAADANNKAALSVDQKLIVSKKALIVNLNSAPAITKVYDGSKSATLSADNYSLIGKVGKDLIVVSGTAAYLNMNVGITTVTAANFVLTGAQKDNYTISTTSATTTGSITAKTITVTANIQSKTYGERDPKLSYTFKPTLVKGDSFTGALTRTAGEKVGQYAINQGTLTLGANYRLNYVDANLTVTNAVIIIKADNQSKTYGTDNPRLTVSYTGFLPGDNVANSFVAEPVVITTSTQSSGAGIYPITASGAISTNYTIVYKPGTLTVNKAVLKVTADNQSRAYRDSNPPLTVSYSGFISGDTEASLTTPATALTTATPTSLPGNYAILAGGAASSNYVFTYTSGTLTVTPLTNADLNNLSISSGTLSPLFNPGTLAYNASVIVGQVTLNPTVADATAVVRVNGSIVSSGTDSNPIALTVGDNVINVEVTSQDGTTRKTYKVTVYRAAPLDVIKPTNVLTPNGDGKNDGWVIKDIQLYPNNKVTIYDRAGREIYSKRDYKNDWDGTLKGVPLQQGTYFYVIELSPGVASLKGFITILKNH